MCKIYISFIKERRKKGKKTDTWKIVTMESGQLGFIKFDGAWRQYIFLPDAHTKWSASCNDQISAFLKEQNSKWRRKIRKKPT